MAMDLTELRNLLRYKTSQTSVCLNGVSRVDQWFVLRLLKAYPDRLRVCCPDWSIWVTTDPGVRSCVDLHKSSSESLR